MNRLPLTHAAIWALILLITHLLPTPAIGGSEKKTVLYLNSYHHGYQWSDSIFEGIRSRLHESSYAIDLQVEYLDAKKYNTPPVIEGLFEVFRKKFTHERFDVVIVSDDDAFNFALRFRDALFPGVPIVFCGVNDLDPQAVARGNLTGVVESFDLIGTLAVALMLHPEKRRMIVIGDESTTGRAIKKQIEGFLAGVPAESIPIAVEPAGSYRFDYQVMRRLNIPDNLLPPGSTLINAPKAFYELPKELFWTIITSLLLLLVTLIFLVLTMLERRRVERRIKDQLTFQETLMDTNPQLVSWKDLNFRYLGANRTFAAFFGLNPQFGRHPRRPDPDLPGGDEPLHQRLPRPAGDRRHPGHPPRRHPPRQRGGRRLVPRGRRLSAADRGR
ncbi:MAG: hypothetical protein ACWGKN_16525 [Desulfoprunum sp.]